MNKSNPVEVKQGTWLLLAGCRGRMLNMCIGSLIGSYRLLHVLRVVSLFIETFLK